jgi:hypothetical protein
LLEKYISKINNKNKAPYSSDDNVTSWRINLDSNSFLLIHACRSGAVFGYVLKREKKKLIQTFLANDDAKKIYEVIKNNG